jgi:signal transduction histidine kinase
VSISGRREEVVVLPCRSWSRRRGQRGRSIVDDARRIEQHRAAAEPDQLLNTADDEMWQVRRVRAMSAHMASKSPRALAACCEEVGRALAGAHDMCAVAWDDSAEPRIACVAGAAQPVFGATDLAGKPAGVLFPGGERAARDLAQSAARGAFEEHRTMLRGGQPFPAQLLLSPAPGGVVAVVRDVAVSQQVADAAVRAEDLARFASLVAHEIRNPLSAVKIALQTLERHGTLAANDLRRTNIALREVLNIELLLNEVLEFARPPSLALVPGDPRSPVREAVEGVEAEWSSRGLSFAVDVPERMAPFPLDPVRVRTAVKILCRQAAVAAEEVGGGRIEVAVREAPPGWQLTVRDPGHAVPPELREKAFVPFTPNRARGTGLGLAVVARVAREHRGDARFVETHGHGNVISVTFGG